MTIRTALASCLWVFLSLLLGCGNSPEPVTEKPPSPVEKAKIALVMKTLTNPFFVSMEKGARQAASELGVDLIVKTAAQETSINQQIDIVSQLVRNKEVSMIVIAPGDSVELIPVLKMAQDSGIGVVNIDNQLDAAVSAKFGLHTVPFISVDNDAAAYLSAKYISDQITTPTQAVILEGITTASNAKARQAGAERAFSENPYISLVASKSANWKIDEAYEVIKSMFDEHPDIGAIFCANDMMAIGVLKYLDESGKGSIPVAAFDAIDEAKAAVKAGSLSVTIDQQPEQQGYMGVKAAVDMLSGKKHEEVMLVDVLVVDRASLQ